MLNTRFRGSTPAAQTGAVVTRPAVRKHYLPQRTRGSTICLTPGGSTICLNPITIAAQVRPLLRESYDSQAATPSTQPTSIVSVSDSAFASNVAKCLIVGLAIVQDVSGLHHAGGDHDLEPSSAWDRCLGCESTSWHVGELEVSGRRQVAWEAGARLCGDAAIPLPRENRLSFELLNK